MTVTAVALWTALKIGIETLAVFFLAVGLLAITFPVIIDVALGLP